jgi:hypothetical protein
MKAHVAVIVALVGILILSGLALAQTGGPGPAPQYAVQAGTSSGGGYRLTGLAWQVGGTAAGGDYGLVVACAPALRGSGCCCTYLPVVVRNVY